ncbi:hypothetical protein GCM10023191_097580 [Actinoallomurus oryzae]|uniref:Uncharacterized protein n=1 Tax=Actinoallomurus oryzae TaxID=502180 RepID=A0ABP8R7S1_9ACTN
MQGVLTGLFAVVGTLVGSVVTYLLQRRSAEHAERSAREQRLWQERLQAYSAFAEATIEFRRSQYDRWGGRPPGPTRASGRIQTGDLPLTRNTDTRAHATSADVKGADRALTAVSSCRRCHHRCRRLRARCLRASGPTGNRAAAFAPEPYGGERSGRSA